MLTNYIYMAFSTTVDPEQHNGPLIASFRYARPLLVTAPHLQFQRQILVVLQYTFSEKCAYKSTYALQTHVVQGLTIFT